jgi:hypothetical protein
MSSLGPALALAAILSTGCSEDPPPRLPASEPEAPAEPVIPTVDALSTVGSGHASAALPAWDPERSRFDHPIRDLPAKLGRGEDVLQVLVGDRPETGAMLTYYGEALPPGSYRVLPATDETRAEHSGHDARIFIATMGQGTTGDLRSESGTVVVEASSDDVLTGTFDLTLRSRNNLRETVARARFHATRDRWLDALLDHQSEISDQMRHR